MMAALISGACLDRPDEVLDRTGQTNEADICRGCLASRNDRRVFAGHISAGEVSTLYKSRVNVLWSSGFQSLESWD